MLPNAYHKEKQLHQLAGKYFKTCKCGKSFKVRPCHYNDPNKKYCSNECRYKYAAREKTAVPKVFYCPQCGKKFERFLGQWNRGNNTYCGSKCAHEAKKNGEIRKCLNCDKEFYTSKARNKKYCCKKCDAIANPRTGFITGANNVGVLNAQYKHGKYAGRNRAGGDSNKEKVRRQVIERDGGKWCLFCGKPGPGLHLHRIIYGSQCGKYEVTNCVQLCNEHHELVHKNKRKWQPQLIQYLSDLKQRNWLVM